MLVAARGDEGDFSKLRADIESVRSRLENSSVHLALLSLAEGRVAFLSGNEGAARRFIELSVQSARASRHKDWLWRALEAQADLEQAAGGLLRARHLREEALALLEEMAASLPRDLREVYWNDHRRSRLLKIPLWVHSLVRGLGVMSPGACLCGAGWQDDAVWIT